MKERWGGTNYKIVLEKMEVMSTWPGDCESIREALMSWMVENKDVTLIEEGEDILDGLEAMHAEEGSEVSEEILMDATEVITAIIVAKGLETKRVAPIFQKGGILTTDRIKRIGRAEGMIRMREEMRKVKNQRIKLNNRNITKNDFEDMELRTKRRRDCSRLERGVLKSDQIDNKYVQDRGAKIQVVGSDVEAL